MAKINTGQWITFQVAWMKNPPATLRFGQHFCNEFNITDPDLFYEQDHHQSVIKASKYVDHQLPYDPSVGQVNKRVKNASQIDRIEREL